MEQQSGTAIEYEVDLHSIYAAYLGVFEASGTEWWDKSWGGFFNSFDDFLKFGWEVMGKGHIAVRREQIGLYARMIRTRFGESLSKDPPTTLKLRPVMTKSMSMRRTVNTITDLAGYRKLAQTLPAAELAYLRLRLRGAEIEVVEQLFDAAGTRHPGVRDNGVGYTWAAVNTVWWEKGSPPSGFLPGTGHTRGRGKGTVLEVGMAVLRCAHLRASGAWPPIPQQNYRRSHLVVEDWVDKRQNSDPPNAPRAYGFGHSRFVAERDVERILEWVAHVNQLTSSASLSSLASQENDGNSNMLILLSAGEAQPLPVPASTTLPHNILHVDILSLEHNLLRRGARAGHVHSREYPLPNLATLLQAIAIPVLPHIPLGNAGNDAFYTLLALQKLLMVDTRLPDVMQNPPSAYHRSSMMPGSLPSARTPSSPRARISSRQKAQTIFWDDSKYKPAVGTPSNTDAVTPVPGPGPGIVRPSTPPAKRPVDDAPQRPKLKQDRSMKDIAGALAKLWVG